MKVVYLLSIALLLSACGETDPGLPFTPRVRYHTTFDAVEKPLSQGGRWHHTKNAFTEVVTENGIAHGTNGAANLYDDSYALLDGFGPNQSVTATVTRSPELNDNVTHEVELLLRMSDDEQGARGYECLFAFYGNVQIVRWNGPSGSFTVLPIQTGNGDYKRQLRNGDVVKATALGNVISLYINGSLMARTTDASYSTGQPGVSFFTRPRGNSAHYGVTDYLAESD